MPRLSINEVTTFRWSFEEDLAHYRAAGIPAIGVWRQKLSDFGDEAGIDRLVESGLAVSTLMWAGGFTGSDGRTYRESIEDAQEAIRLAASISAGSLIVYSGGRHGHTNNHARRLMRGALEELAPMAADLDVQLAVEPMHPRCAEQFTFLTDLDETIELIDSVGSDHVRLVFDTYHFGHEAGILDKVPAIVDHLAIVQLGDAKAPPDLEQSRCRLGAGCLPLAELIAALSQAGYDGDYDVELIGEEIETDDYHDLLTHCKQTFEQFVGALASE